MKPSSQALFSNYRNLVATIILAVTTDAAKDQVNLHTWGPHLGKPLDEKEHYDLYEFALACPDIARRWQLNVDGVAVKRMLVDHIEGTKLLRWSDLVNVKRKLQEYERKEREDAQ